MKGLLVGFLLWSGFLVGVQTPEQALKRLQAGNDRFVKEKLLHPDRTQERRLSLAEGQSPFAVIVTCSDSRVVPEVIFDEGLGDLFVIRVAGNVVGLTEVESIIYAVDHLNPAIVVVMGHESCGAVDAVVHSHDQDIPTIAKLIEPSVQKARGEKGSNLLKRSIEYNAIRMQQDLLSIETIQKKVQTRSLGVYSAYYNLQSGAVDLLTPAAMK